MAPLDRLAVHVLDPSYGPALDPLEGDTAAVDAAVERERWGPVDPAPQPPGPLVFVDGAQQIEAWLQASVPGEPGPIVGLACALAAGAVLTAPGERARVAAVRSRRLVLTVGDRCLRLPPSGGFAWEPVRASAEEGTGLARRVGQLRQEMEHSLAEAVAEPERMVVLDGRLSFVRDAGGPVVGAIKSHQRMYLGPRESLVVPALAVGQRTPLFAIGEDRWSWYQRLPGAGADGWAGILRGELPRTLDLASARALADRAAAELPRFAGRAHRDPRAPQNLAPIGGLEARLRHRLGDRRLALRAARRSAAAATLAPREPASVAA
jgi:uncharacterized protein